MAQRPASANYGEQAPLPEQQRRQLQQQQLGMPSAAPAPQAPPPVAPQPHQAAPTNYVNFSRRFSANKDVATREAAKYGQQASTAAGAAQSALGAAQQKFATGVNTGTVQGPAGGPSTNTGGGAPPPSNAAPVPPQPPPPAPPPAPASQALSGESTRPDASSQALTGESTRPPDGPSMADMLAKAGQQYTGPEGLDDAAAAQAAEKAQQQLGALKDNNGIQALVNESGPSGTQGADKLSASLIGQAGRGDFDALRAKFNPNKDLLDAQANAVKTAAQAKEDSAKNASAWGDAAKAKGASDAQMADVNSKNDATAKAARDAASQERLNTVPVDEANQGNPLAGIDASNPEEFQKRTAEIAAWNAAQKSTTNDTVNNAFEDFNSVMSPVNWATNAAGVRDPGQDYETKNAHGGSGAASGGTNGRNIDWAAAGPQGFWVFRSMTPDDWKTLNSKPRNGANGQGAWIKTKFNQLVAAQKAKSSGSAPAVGTSRSG